jgi:hypothetical protein
MRIVFNAFYIALFISFVRKIMDKVKAPFDFSPRVERPKPDADEYFIYANDVPIFWSGCLEEAEEFFYEACSRCHSLATKLKIVQTDDSIPLCACESTGCSEDEVAALNEVIDRLE